MNILNAITFRHHTIEVVKFAFKLLNVDVTKTTLKNDLQNHPEYPNLLSVSDTLNRYNVENISFASAPDNLQKLPLPFFALIKNENKTKDFLTLVTSIDGNVINYYNPVKQKTEGVSVGEFLNRWPSRLVTIVESENAKGENDYLKKHKIEALSRFVIGSLLLLIPLLVIAISIGILVKNGDNTGAVGFFIASFIGSIVCSLLIWYELDEYNPLMQQICGGTKKQKCGAVLNSKASSIWGISWSSIGFTYFVGSFLLLLSTEITNLKVFFTLSWLNLFAIPYVPFSIYYQKYKAKQWCVLCLFVQGLLVLQFIFALLAGAHDIRPLVSEFRSEIWLGAMGFFIPALFCYLFIPSYRSEKRYRRKTAEFSRLKYDRQIFETVLSKQKSVVVPENLGLKFGNPTAAIKIVQVCSPYCGPCGYAHQHIEELISDNPHVQVQIIFTASSEQNDRTNIPVRHFLSLFEQFPDVKMREALNYWYAPDNQNYQELNAKYPLISSSSPKEHKLEIDAMFKWCNDTNVSFTPTFFISLASDKSNSKGSIFFQCPSIYTPTDLKQLFSNYGSLPNL